MKSMAPRKAVSVLRPTSLAMRVALEVVAELEAERQAAERAGGARRRTKPGPESGRPAPAQPGSGPRTKI
ncbi:MAG: hypothetical protein JWP97_5655 [Labilithrix sp.]|nr:hypothetical protein [Labilithrix sp.]